MSKKSALPNIRGKLKAKSARFKVTGHSTSLSFDEAMKDAICKLNELAPTSSEHSENLMMSLQVVEIDVALVGLTKVPHEFAVTISAAKKAHS